MSGVSHDGSAANAPHRLCYAGTMSDPPIPGLGPGYRLTVEDEPAEADVEVLPHALEAYNESQWPQHPPWRPLAIFLRKGRQRGRQRPASAPRLQPDGGATPTLL